MDERFPLHRRSVPVYVGAGGIATASHYAVAIAAVESGSMTPLLATTLGFAVGAALKYWLNYTAAFRSRAPHGQALVRFVVTLAVLMGVNAVLFELLHRMLGFHYVLAQVVATLLLVPPGYLIHRHWVYRTC